MKKVFLACVALLLLAASSARAGDVIIYVTPEENADIVKKYSKVSVVTKAEPVLYSSGPYFLIQGGVYGPANGSGEHYSAYEANPGFAGDLIVGYRINPMWSFQLDGGYQGSEGLAGFDYMAMPVTTAVRFGLPTEMFEPYLLAGGGLWFTKTTLNEGAESVDEVVLGGYFGIGALLHFDNKMMAGIEARYQMLDLGNAPNDGLLLFGSVGYEY
jgi:opacity protein-like surface antigen